MTSHGYQPGRLAVQIQPSLSRRQADLYLHRGLTFIVQCRGHTRGEVIHHCRTRGRRVSEGLVSFAFKLEMSSLSILNDQY